ncbi:energy-coupling factor ABC transporter ATP-binding protein, partial [Paenibacillus thailandensis]
DAPRPPRAALHSGTGAATATGSGEPCDTGMATATGTGAATATGNSTPSAAVEEAPLYPVTLREAAVFFERRGDRFYPAQAGTGGIAEQRAEAQPTVVFEHVSAGYKTISRTDHSVLRNVSLTLREGERIAVVGSNGAGKSTLLKLISGIRKPTSGSVTVCGYETRKVSPEHLSDYVSYIYQQPEEMFIEDTIRKDIAYFLKARRRPETERLVEDLIGRLRLAGLADRDGRLLSGGQQRRATLAIGLAMQPAVMLLDEPTASLDASSRREVTALLAGQLTNVKTVVIATHDMQLVAEWASRVIVMHNGEVALDTDRRSLFANGAVLEKAGLTPPQITLLGAALGMEPPCLSVDEFMGRITPSYTKEECPVGSH